MIEKRKLILFSEFLQFLYSSFYKHDVKHTALALERKCVRISL